MNVYPSRRDKKMENLIGNMINANNKFYFSFFSLGFYFYSAGYFAFQKSYKNPMRYSLYYPQVLQH
jgi:hypothetical protein